MHVNFPKTAYPCQNVLRNLDFLETLQWRKLDHALQLHIHTSQFLHQTQTNGLKNGFDVLATMSLVILHIL